MKRAILRYVRTDYAKIIRKQYEKGLVSAHRSDLRTYEPRPDGIANTITTVLKDNYLIEYKEDIK